MKLETSIRVGVCGFAESQAGVFADFDVLEVQKTFYQPPRPGTAARWRERAPAGFEFTLKAWQLVTHEHGSPTYRRLTERLSERDLTRAGGFRWNAVTRMAWERTREIAALLDAPAIVLQTPARFRPTAANLGRMRRFFEAIERDGRRLVFEPRGDAWDDRLVRQVIESLDLVHGVDPFLRRPLGRGMRYFRLHGRPAYHYRYRYTDEDLDTLATRINRAWPHYILFNNDRMADDARRFRARL